MSRQNFVDGRENLLSSSDCPNAFDWDGGSQPLISSTPDVRLSLAADDMTAALCPHDSTVPWAGDAGCVLTSQGRYFFSASQRRTFFLLSTLFLQAKLEPTEAFSFLFIIFHSSAVITSRSLVQGIVFRSLGVRPWKGAAFSQAWTPAAALDGSSLAGFLIGMRGEGNRIKETHLAKSRRPPATLPSVYAGGLQYTTARCSPGSWAGTVCAGLDPACSLCVSLKWFKRRKWLLIVGAMVDEVGGLPLLTIPTPSGT